MIDVDKGLVDRVIKLEREICNVLDKLSFYAAVCEHNDQKKILWDRGRMARETIARCEAALGPLGNLEPSAKFPR